LSSQLYPDFSNQYLLIDGLIEKAGIVIQVEPDERNNDRYDGYLVFKERNIFRNDVGAYEKLRKIKLPKSEQVRFVAMKYAMALIEEEIGLSAKALKED